MLHPPYSKQRIRVIYVPSGLSENISLHTWECCLFPEHTQKPRAPLFHVWKTISWYGKEWEKEKERELRSSSCVATSGVYYHSSQRDALLTSFLVFTLQFVQETAHTPDCTSTCADISEHRSAISCTPTTGDL